MASTVYWKHWHDCIKRFLLIFQAYLCAVNLPSYNIPKVTGKATKNTELIVIFMKPAKDSVCFVSWRRIMLELAVVVMEECTQSATTQIGCGSHDRY